MPFCAITSFKTLPKDTFLADWESANIILVFKTSSGVVIAPDIPPDTAPQIDTATGLNAVSVTLLHCDLKYSHKGNWMNENGISLRIVVPKPL